MDDRELLAHVEQIFHSAVELHGAARTEFVRRECGRDEELRRRVESLLEADTGALPVGHPVGPEPPVRSFGRYRLISKLGDGGMGAVYLACDTELNRDVALKTLPPAFALDAERKRRFLREARAASALNHPNIVSIYDFGHESDLDFYVMEYVRGKTLDRLIPSTGLKLQEALDYALAIGGALQAAHVAGIVHRDIKPANIIVDGRGVPKVLDFGIAKVASQRAAFTASASSTETNEGMVIGTIAYMSPEQAEGRPVDARSDIFSFGSLLYEMITGRRAFERDSNTATLTAILRDEPMRADSFVQDIPPELCRVLERCLHKDPAQRYQRISDVIDDLERARTARRPRGRRPWPLWYAAAAAFLVLSAAAVYWFIHTRSPAAPGSVASAEQYRLIPLTADPGLEIGPSFSPDGNQIAFQHQEPGNSPFHIFIKLIGQNDAVQLTRDSASDLSPAWSPDGRSIAFVRNWGLLEAGGPTTGPWALMLIPSIGGPERKVAELRHFDWPGGLSWHPGGDWIAVADQGDGGLDVIYVVSVSTGTTRQLTTPLAGNKDESPAFAPDGNSLLFTRGLTDGIEDLYTIGLTREVTPIGSPQRLTFTNGFVGTPAWAPDGRSVLYSGGNVPSPSLWRVWVHPTRSEPRNPVQIPGAGVGVRTPALSNNGRLAFALATIDIDIWRVDLKKQANRPEPDWDTKVAVSTRQEHTVKFSPDDNRLAFASMRSGTHEIWVSNKHGRDALQLTSFGGPYTAAPFWSPDGQMISFSSQAGGNWAVYTVPAQGGAIKRLTEPRLQAQGSSWTPDGQWIYCEIQGQLWKVPAAGGNPVQITRLGGGVPAQSPDGRTIFYAKDGGSVEFSRLWTVPVEGGEEREVLPVVFSHNVVARKDGIYFIPSPDKPAIWFFKFADRKLSMLARLRSTPAYGMDVSKDGRTALVPEYEETGGDIMMIENFR